MIVYGSRHPVLALVLLLPCIAGANGVIGSEKMLLAGEIVVTKSPATVETSTKANKQVNKNQKSVSVEQKQSVPDDSSEEGVLSPRGGAPAEQREYDARLKEKSRQQALENTVYPVAPPMYLPMPVATPAPVAPAPVAPSTQDRAAVRGDKARAYVTQGGEAAVNSRRNSAGSAGR